MPVYAIMAVSLSKYRRKTSWFSVLEAWNQAERAVIRMKRIVQLSLALALVIGIVVTVTILGIESQPRPLANVLDKKGEVARGDVHIGRIIEDGTEPAIWLSIVDDSFNDSFLDKLLAMEVRRDKNQGPNETFDSAVAVYDNSGKELYKFLIVGERMLLPIGAYYVPVNEGELRALLEGTWDVAWPAAQAEEEKAAKKDETAEEVAAQ